MSKIFYKKEKNINHKKILRSLGLGLFLVGASLSLYIFSPLILWQIYSAPSFSSHNIESPIPRKNVLNPSLIQSLIAQAKNSIGGTDYTNAQNWFPGFKSQANAAELSPYTLTIPALKIKDAVVSGADYDLSKHLVNYQGTSTPPNKGNAVIFGHSTLPQLYDPKDYKTIFANILDLKIGDKIFTNVDGVTYSYKVYNIYVVDAENTSVFSQSFDDSYITLVTCTPPGTIWKRLVIKARLEKI